MEFNVRNLNYGISEHKVENRVFSNVIFHVPKSNRKINENFEKTFKFEIKKFENLDFNFEYSAYKQKTIFFPVYLHSDGKSDALVQLKIGKLNIFHSTGTQTIEGKVFEYGINGRGRTPLSANAKILSETNHIEAYMRRKLPERRSLPDWYLQYTK